MNPPGASSRVLPQARVVAAGLLAGVLATALAARFIPTVGTAGFLVGPAALGGAVAPVIGYRLYAWHRDAARQLPDAGRRGAAYLTAVILALAVTEAFALLGIVVFMLSGHPLATLGVFGHVLLTGAIWPNPERLGRFVGDD